MRRMGGVEIDPNKVVIYIRWSTDDQGSGTTLDTQRDACLHYAKSQGWNVADDQIFVDDGYSGGNLERPGIIKIRELVKQEKVQCIVIYKIDRLSRNIVDATSLVLDEWDGSCYLKCVMEPVDTTTELGRMIFGILAMFADFERSQIRTRTFGGKVKRAAQGRNPGIRLPFGYKHGLDRGEVLIDEENAAIVRRIFQLYSAGNGTARIAGLLNDEGIPAPRGRFWSVSTLNDLLSNRRYVGDWTYGKTRKSELAKHGKGPKRVLNETPLAQAERKDLQLVPLKLWERCQELREENVASMERTSGRAISSDHLLSGLVKCRCGSAMQIQTNGSSSDGKRYFLYRCIGRFRKGRAFCDAGTIADTLLDGAVRRFVLRLHDPAIMSVIQKSSEGELQKELADTKSLIAGVNKRLSELDDEMTNIRRDYRSKALDVRTFNELRMDIERETKEQQARLEEYQEETQTIQESLSSSGRLLDTIRATSKWDTYSIAEKKVLLRQLLDGVVVYRKAGSKEPAQVQFIVRGLDKAVVAEIQKQAEPPVD